MTGSSRGGSMLVALISALGLLIVFVVFFNLFLIVPFFIFLGGLVAMVVSDRRRGREESVSAKGEGT